MSINVEIRVGGEVPADVLSELANTSLVSKGLETVLRGPVQDQAALIGIINWLQMLGLELHEVREVAPSIGNCTTGETGGL